MDNINDNIESVYKPELLVPAGDFECLVAGVQNGADAIYLGSDMFSARANAKNFSKEALKNAIEYCKIHNVKTNLTINTLILDSEFNDAVDLAKYAYEQGIDAIIVQDLGFAKYLIDNFKGLNVHASTQMSIHNLEGVLELQDLGFKRVVLSRELSMAEIEYIRNNSKVELEMFIHGALCISYSGQCLFSSLIGGRSGNRGKCAQACRLPYELVAKDNSDSSFSTLDKGYLLSPRDLCSLKYLPDLLNIGINSFKVEGRMKSPDYVATVTRIYRKYIDLALTTSKYIIDEKDQKDLLQVFNRGGFSSGHLSADANQNLIYKEKCNNIGLFLGNISNYNENQGHITLKINENLNIGDGISIEGETGTYTVSELMISNNNIKEAHIGDIVKLGRMKGRIKIGSKVYKISSKQLVDSAKLTYSENANVKKIPIKCFLTIKKGLPIEISLQVKNQEPFYSDVNIHYTSNVFPEDSISSPISEDRLIKQFSKLGNTPYCLEEIHIDMDNNLYIPSISSLNDIRRIAIDMLMTKVINSNKNSIKELPSSIISNTDTKVLMQDEKKISLLLENINESNDYSKLEGIDNLYIPLRLLVNKKYEDIILMLSNKFDTYVYMPTIMKANYKNLFLNSIDDFVETYNIKGFVISNMAGFKFLNKYILNKDSNKSYRFISNYTLNVFNKNTAKELSLLGIDTITPSIELSKKYLQDILNDSTYHTETIVYARSILMHTSYCLLGSSNKCFPTCDMKCKDDKQYYLKDRLGFLFRILPNNIQTVTSIYNSKITSIDNNELNSDYLRINVLDENIDEINNIIRVVKSGSRLEGPDFTNGNLNRII